MAALAVPLASLATSAPAAAATPWVASNVPTSGLNPASISGPSLDLSGISCVSSTSCLAVGSYLGPFGPQNIGIPQHGTNGLIEVGTFSGGVWSWVASTAPTSGLSPPAESINTNYVVLTSISCGSPTSCVAAGNYVDDANGNWGVIETGTLSAGSWNWVASTAPTSGLSPAALATPVDNLWAVSCGSATSCVVTGNYRDTAEATDGLIETGSLSGTTWTWVASNDSTTGLSPPSVTPAFVKLSGVSCVTATSCVVAGSYRYDVVHDTDGLIETGTFSGGAWTWTAVTAPTSDLSPASNTTASVTLSAMSCVSPTSCVAAGSYLDASSATDGLVETGSRSGSTWTWVDSPLPTAGLSPASQASPFVSPSGVSCASTTTCVVAGSYRDTTAATNGLLETGTLSGGTWTWSAATAPLNGSTPSGSTQAYVFAVSCGSASTCVGAGTYGNTSGGLIETGTLGPGSVTATLTASTPTPGAGTQFSLDLHVTNTTSDTQDIALGTATANPSPGVTITPPVGPITPLAGGQSVDLTYTATIAQAGGEVLTTPLAATDESSAAVTNLAPTATVTAAAPDLVVNSTADDALPPDSATANVCDVDLTTPGNQCTLRAAIQLADLRSGTQAIVFDIPGAGVPTIAPTSALPAATVPVTIDGTTQTGGWVQLSGTGAPTATGLSITAGASTVRGLVVNGWATGISLTGAGGDLVAGNRIGTDTTGTSAVPNGVGISLHVPDSTIGATTTSSPGTCSGDCNVISGNTTAGVSAGDVDLPLPARSRIVGNFVGTDLTGQAAVGNGVGIDLRETFSDQQSGLAPDDSVLVGGPTPVPGTAPGNVVSANVQTGILAGGAQSTLYSMTVQGNLVGATADGTATLGNPVGIADASSGDVIGGNAPDDRNVVGGSTLQGIESAGLVEGNLVGVGPSGVLLKNVVGVAGIEGGATLCGNTVSGNTTGLQGVLSLDSGNRIGTDPTGSQAVPNQVGIAPTTLSSGLDSRCADLGPDIVSGNTQAGVVDQTPDGNASISVGRMYVGTDSTGKVAIPNGVGFQLSGGTNSSEFVTIGASIPSSTNGSITSVQPCAYPCVLVSGNSGPGISVGSTLGTVGPTFDLHNSGIGVTVLGTALQNNGDGLHSDVRLVPGGVPSGITDNVISNDRGYGINIAGAAFGVGSVPFPSASTPSIRTAVEVSRSEVATTSKSPTTPSATARTWWTTSEARPRISRPTPSSAALPGTWSGPSAGRAWRRRATSQRVSPRRRQAGP